MTIKVYSAIHVHSNEDLDTRIDVAGFLGGPRGEDPRFALRIAEGNIYLTRRAAERVASLLLAAMQDWDMRELSEHAAAVEADSKAMAADDAKEHSHE